MTDPIPHPGSQSGPEPDGVRLAPGVVVGEGVLHFSATTSSGPGGQNANRRSTRAVLRVAIAELPITPGARARLRRSGGSLVVGEPPADEIVLSNEDTRSLTQNKAAVLDRLRELVMAAITPPVPRKPTKPTKGSKKRRLKAKRERGEIKQRRKRPEAE